MIVSPSDASSPFIQTAHSGPDHRSITSDALFKQIHAEVSQQPHLGLLRDFNHAHLKIVSEQFGGAVNKSRVLDIGASIHGYALEAAILQGYNQYIGIDLGITRQWGKSFLEVQHEERRHLLCQMDAHRLWFEDESMDVVLCLSGFEHYLFPDIALQEILRVLRKGGVALISYEPIWTCSYGHHLHHFGIGFDQVPPWSHLFLSKTQMSELLRHKPWPKEIPITREEAVEWIYDTRDINRRDFVYHEKTLGQVTCDEVFWRMPHAESSPVALVAVDYVASLLPYKREQLLSRGFSFCFRK